MPSPSEPCRAVLIDGFDTVIECVVVGPHKINPFSGLTTHRSHIGQEWDEDA